VAYLRISSTTQLKGFGLDGQRKAVRQWVNAQVNAHGHRIIAEYVDAGVSGATDAVDRPALSDALEQIGWPSHAGGWSVRVARPRGWDRVETERVVEGGGRPTAWYCVADVVVDVGQFRETRMATTDTVI